MCGLIRTPDVVLLINQLSLRWYHPVLSTEVLYQVLKSESDSPPISFFFFKIVLAIVSPLHFQLNLRFSLSLPSKGTDLVLIGILLNLWIHFMKKHHKYYVSNSWHRFQLPWFWSSRSKGKGESRYSMWQFATHSHVKKNTVSLFCRNLNLLFVVLETILSLTLPRLSFGIARNEGCKGNEMKHRGLSLVRWTAIFFFCLVPSTKIVAHFTLSQWLK